jgi:insulysin
MKRTRHGEQLHIEFPVEDQTPYYETQPTMFLASLIGHESEGSLLSYLKSKDWANGLDAGTTDSATGWSGFQIDIDLTETGKSKLFVLAEDVADVQTAVQNDIVVALFSYLKMLRLEGPSERIFKEYAMYVRSCD